MLELLEYSIEKKMKHIPSALSQYSYLRHILQIVHKNNFNIVIGKPFGAQAYYLIWEKLRLRDKDKEIQYGVKHNDYDFINFSEETLGNALGVAGGIALADNKITYCNISDGALQMGPTLEAIQFIGENKLPIILTIDINNYQLTRKISNRINYYKNIFYKWDVVHIKFGESLNIFNDYINTCKPVVFLIETKKGCGVKEMEDNPIEWHYKKLKDINDVTIS